MVNPKARLTEVSKARSEARAEIDRVRKTLNQSNEAEMEAFTQLKRKYASLDREFTQLISQLD